MFLAISRLEADAGRQMRPGADRDRGGEFNVHVASSSFPEDPEANLICLVARKATKGEANA
jgi:hypothetical protein